MGRKAAAGIGTIREKTMVRSGKQYTYWEVRFTAGYDPGTGKQVQRNIIGKTQKEIAQKLKAATAAIGQGTYTAPCKLTVGEWLDTWAVGYLGGVKPTTVRVHKNNLQRRIKPVLGVVILSEPRSHMVQKFIDGMKLSSFSARLAYEVLHQALEKAVKLKYISRNPATGCELPGLEQKETHPLEDQQVVAPLRAAKGGRPELLVSIVLFTGLRQSELLGSTWDCMDFQKGVLLVNKQLSRILHREESGLFLSPKNGKSRTTTPAPSVFKTLKGQRRRQAEMQLKAGSPWDNVHNLVFINETGGPLEQWRVEKDYQAAVEAVGLVGARFHDLRHIYTTNATRAGDDIKIIQGSLDHVSATFTLGRYGYFTERMRQGSAARMEGFIKDVLGL